MAIEQPRPAKLTARAVLAPPIPAPGPRPATGIMAMSTAVGLSRFGLPPAGPGQRGRLHDHGAARSAIPGPALLRLAANGGVAGDPGPRRQPQTGPAPD